MNAACCAGRFAEQAAARFFQSQGYQLLDKNFNVPRLGELDLVLMRHGTITVAEVKARSQADQFGGLPASITPAKIRRLRRTTLYYLKEKKMMNRDVSILATFVQLDLKGQIVSIVTEPIEWR
jgi:Holliday junction resolvase-like predicted endonuclease